MAYLGEVVVKVVGDTAQFNKSINDSQAKMRAFGASAVQVGKNLTASLTLPLVAIGTASVLAFGKQEEALARLKAAIKSTGKETEISVDSLQEYAAELQKVTKFGDEASLQALALVQQLGNLNEEGLKALLPRMQDFSTAMGIDMQAAASLIGKTLGSTTNALSRYGIEIDASAEGTDKLEQLLAALDEKFKGTAEAVAEKGTGPIIQFGNTVGDAAEEIGESLMPIIIAILEPIKEMAEAFTELDDETQDLIVTLGLIAASIGPVIFLIGKITSSTNALLGPISLAVAGVGLLVGVFSAIEAEQVKFNNRFTDGAEKIEKQRTRIDELLIQYDDLKGESEDNEEAQGELKKVIAEIAELLPNSIVQFDEYGEAIGIAREEASSFSRELGGLELEELEKNLALRNEQLEALKNELPIIRDRVAGEEEYIESMEREIELIEEKARLEGYSEQRLAIAKSYYEEEIINAQQRLDILKKGNLADIGQKGTLEEIARIEEEILQTETQISDLKIQLDPIARKAYEDQLEYEKELAKIQDDKLEQAKLDAIEEERLNRERLDRQEEYDSLEEKLRRAQLTEKERAYDDLEIQHREYLEYELDDEIWYQEQLAELRERYREEEEESSRSAVDTEIELAAERATAIEKYLNQQKEDQKAYNEEIKNQAEELYDKLEQWTGTYFDVFGDAIAQGKLDWESLKEAMKGTIVALLKMLSRQLFVQAWELILKPVWMGGSKSRGIALLGISAAARLAAGIVAALEEGGLVNPTQGGTIARIGEGKDAEAVLPLNDDVMGRIAERISVNMQPQANIFQPTNNITFPQQITVDIGGVQFDGMITDRIRNGNIQVAPRGIAQR